MLDRCMASLLMLFALAVPALAQEAADADSSTTQYALMAAAVVILILYLRRRKKRKSLD